MLLFVSSLIQKCLLLIILILSEDMSLYIKFKILNRLLLTTSVLVLTKYTLFPLNLNAESPTLRTIFLVLLR